MYQCFQLNINEALQKMTDTSFCLNKIKNKITKRVLEEIYLLYVSNTYHMNFECVWVHLYLLEVAMLVYDVYKL